MMAAVSVWGVFYLIHLLYRTAFEYRDFSDRPLNYASGEIVLRRLQWVAFGVLFVLAARRSDAEFLVLVILSSSTFYVIADWWAYRRELKRWADFRVQRNLMERGVAIGVARTLLARRALGEDSYRMKRKKAWVAFLLTLFFGPFGFIYFRWQITLAIFVAILPWSLLSRAPLRWAFSHGDFRYSVLLWMAALAFVQVCRTNDKLPFSSAK
jgi:hypothetical protein